MLLGIRTVIFKVPDLAKAKAWYTEAFGIAPYFDAPYYVGFQHGGFELGLDPDVKKRAPGPGGSCAYWGVSDLAQMLQKLEAKGVEVAVRLQEVGGDIKVATIRDPFGNEIGLIENPHFGQTGDPL